MASWFLGNFKPSQSSDESGEKLKKKVDESQLVSKSAVLASKDEMTAKPSNSSSEGGPKRVICHGRVDRLEDKVPELWWKTVFADSMYLKTDGDVVEDPDITKDEINQLIKSIPEVQDIFTRKDNASNGGLHATFSCSTVS